MVAAAEPMPDCRKSGGEFARRNQRSAGAYYSSSCARAVFAVTAPLRAPVYVSVSLDVRGLETVFAFHPVLPMRAALVAAAAAALALLALASLSPTVEVPRPRASVAQEPQFRVHIAAPAVRDPVVLAGDDSANR